MKQKREAAKAAVLPSLMVRYRGGQVGMYCTYIAQWGVCASVRDRKEEAAYVVGVCR